MYVKVRIVNCAGMKHQKVDKQECLPDSDGSNTFLSEDLSSLPIETGEESKDGHMFAFEIFIHHIDRSTCSEIHQSIDWHTTSRK